MSGRELLKRTGLEQLYKSGEVTLETFALAKSQRHNL